MEEAVRKVAETRNLNLVVYTGTHGNLELLGSDNNTPKKIYLAFDAKRKGLIPAPLYYWKVVHNPSTNQATAIIGINNGPSFTATDITTEKLNSCKDVCQGVPWINDNINSDNRKDNSRGSVILGYT